MEKNKFPIRKIVEISIILIILHLSLFLGLASFKGQINHEYPVGYFASDAFWHQGSTDCLSTQNSTAFYCDYMVMGHKDVLAFDPPLLNHLTAMVSSISGINVYDIMPFLTIFFLIISILLFYVLIKRFNPDLALLALPFTLFVFQQPFSYSFLFGQWNFLSGSLYLIALFWLVSRIELKYSFVLLAINLTALALSHASELIFGVLFLIGYCLFKILFQKEKIKSLKDYVWGFIIFIPLSIYYLILFSISYLKNDNSKFFTVAYEASGFPTVNITNFSTIILILIILGIVLSGFMFFFNKKYHPALFSALFMLVIGYSNYIGFANRAFQTRFLWPVYLSFFIGIILYYGLDKILTFTKKISEKISDTQSKLKEIILKISQGKEVIVILASLIAIIIIGIQVSNVMASDDGLMDKYHWEAITYFHNTPSDSKILFVYGDIYNQDQMLWNTRRLTNRINIEKYIAAVEEGMKTGKLKREFLMDPITTYLPYHESGLKFSQHEWVREVKDICIYDYWVFDLVGKSQPLIVYEQALRQELLGNNTEVLNNGVVSIVKNNRVGGDCFE